MRLLVAIVVVATAFGVLSWESPVGADPDPWHLISPADPDPQADPGADRFLTGWIGLSQIAGGTRPVSYRKADDGSMRFRGVAVGLGVAPAPVEVLFGQPAFEVFRLPCGYRPTERTYTSVSTVSVNEDVSGTTGTGAGVAAVDTNGSVYVTASDLVVDNAGSQVLRGGVIFDVVIDADEVVTGTECDSAPAKSLYVATDGSDSDPGTIEEPLATLGKAMQLAKGADQVIMRGGTYHTGEILITKSGADGAPIDIMNYPGEQPVLDGSQIMGERTGPNDYRVVLKLNRVSWLNVTGLEITGGPYLGIQCQGCSNTNWTGLRVHDNYGTGMQLIDHDSSYESADNVIAGSDFYNNHDAVGLGEGGDGLEVWNLNGAGNRLIENRYWDNTDDGLDLFDTKTVVQVIENWSWRNGVNQWYDTDGYLESEFEGDGFGFKLGGDGVGSPLNNPPDVAHVVVRSMAWDNELVGFDSNGNGKLAAFHNTAFRNQWRGFNIYKETAANEPPESATDTDFDIRNNAAIGNLGVHWYLPQFNTTIVDFVFYPNDEEMNTWDDPNVTATDADIDTSATAQSAAEAVQRPPSGELPATTWLHLSAGSDLIDTASVITGQPDFDQGTPNGNGPDYGAHEAS